MGETGVGPDCEPGKKYKDERQSGDRGKQPTMLGMSAHKRTGC
jgi:hypothetical protein